MASGCGSVLELVFKKLEPMCMVVKIFGWMNFLIFPNAGNVKFPVHFVVQGCIG